MFFNRNEKKRRESYEQLYGQRFPNSQVFDLENSSEGEGSSSSKNDVFGTELSSFIEQEEPTMAECCGWVRNRFFTKRKLKRLFPPASWLPHYSLEDAKGDIVAGISVAFTIVPQGIAYASLAGLPPQYGLYTSFIGCIVYSLLGTCKDMAVGPTSIVSMLVLPYAMIGGPQYAILLAFLCGLLQLISGILNLGFIVDFISFPVISAFSLAASMTIAASQLKGFFGLNYAASRFPEIMVNFFSNLAHTNLADVGLGCLSLLFLLPLQLLKDYKWAIDPNQSRVKQVMNRVAFFFWSLLIISRNAMAVLIGSLVAIYYGKIVDDQGNITGNIFTLTRNITPGVPPFQMPQFEVIDQNNTVSKTFSEVYSDLNTGMIVISLVGLIESVAVANAFKSSDRKLDASQEMIAIGASNILGSFFGAFPATGSFSRSAVNHNSGVRTPLGGVLTGGLVLLALSVFSKYFTFIPEAVLAGIVITAVIFMGHPSDLLIIWKTSRIDLLPYLVTFGSSMLIGLDVGILIGIAFSLVLLLYYMARPHIYSVRKMSPNGYPFLYVKPDRSIFFSSIEYMKVKINQNLQKTHHFATGKDGQEKKIVVVVDGEHMFRTDSTFALGMKNMVSNMKNRDITVIFYRLRRVVFRVIVGVSMHPTSFHNCRSEEEVYQLIKSINETRLKHSTSLCLSTLQRERGSECPVSPTFHNEFGSRHKWFTHSLDQF